jgi:hypothetical protein
MLLVGLITIAGMFALWPSPEYGPAEPAEPAPLRALASEGPTEAVPAVQPAPPVPPETPAPADGEDMRMGEADGKLPQASTPATENDGGSTPGPASASGKTAASAPFSTRAALKRLGTLAASARECGEAGDVLPNSTLELTIYIAPSGKGRARAKLETLTHVKCIVQLVNALRFEPSTSGGRVIHTYRL